MFFWIDIIEEQVKILIEEIKHRNLFLNFADALS